jgi:ATP-dependent exoDNAse (exonuclease V) beta subunit
MSIADADQREQALDPLHSFCVSAPAGSGKTELLIQRYLQLLSRVRSPEQVLAITFTRKAAAEMRQRVVDALRAAQQAEPCASPHEHRTRALAEQALEADGAGNWHLTRDINRINIKTIDSFCGSLTRQMPVLSEFGGQAAIVDNALELYQEAVLELFAELDGKTAVAEDLKVILSHFDNNWQRVQDLLVSMLARRDQWREYISLRDEPEQAETFLLDTVQAVVGEELTKLGAMLAPVAEPLLQLQQYAADNLQHAALEQVPGSGPEQLANWRALRDLLLTKQGGWRKTVDKRAGFPAGGKAEKARKEQLYAIIASLQEQDGLHETLSGLASLPETETGADSWSLVLHLFHVLPHLAARLLLVFSRRGQVDHSQVALSALQALGEDEAPTELALRLDYRIEHILVDEFQDTAINQYELVRRLTRGWGAHNAINPLAARSIMIVGDGMQSIYGFRDANVGLFLKAREEGFNGIVPVHLNLLCNFRSDAGIVDWVNQTFAWAFPRRDDMRRGQVKFTDAVAVKPEYLAPAVVSHGFSGDFAREQEVIFVCDQVRVALADENCGSIAILGRSRGHLQPLLQAFKQHDIAYSAQDMDSLGDSPPVLDLVNLCRALGNQADRVAWLSLLRSPWCGLQLPDLHRVGSWGEGTLKMPVWMAINDPDMAAGLSSDAVGRLDHLRNGMLQAQRMRDRLALRIWLEQLWLQLGGPATVVEENQLQDVERFFQLLEKADSEGVGLDVVWLEQQLEKIKISEQHPDSKLQVMTLHKAKGLEFDWVFIPGLARLTRSDSRQLLLWDDYTDDKGQRGFLLAADDHSKEGEPTLYNYLQQQRKQKSRLENTRLLYVGATRAARHLVLSACLNADEKSGDWKTPPANSLLYPIWETFSQQVLMHEPSQPPAVTDGPQDPQAYRLAELPANTSSLHSVAIPEQGANIPARKLNRLERHVGTVVHLALEQLSLMEHLPVSCQGEDLDRWKMALRRLGLCGESLQQAVAAVAHNVDTTLADPQGRWILSNQHLSAHSEYAVSCTGSAGRVMDLVIDRTFVDRSNEDCWIVDYKTSRPQPDDTVQGFLAREAEHYREQLLSYRDALAQLGAPTIRCALYFSAIGEFYELKLEA